jgi:hypothetical protein
MKISLIPFFSLLAAASSQKISGQPDSYIYPGDGIDFEACFRDLDAADNIIRDGFVQQNEFLGLVLRYARRKCLTLNNQQVLLAFHALSSCVCASLEGQDASCCLGVNGQLDTGGALTPSARTEPQVQFPTSTCTLLHNTLPETVCAPENQGPFATSSPATSPPTSQPSGGLTSPPTLPPTSGTGGTSPIDILILIIIVVVVALVFVMMFFIMHEQHER